VCHSFVPPNTHSEISSHNMAEWSLLIYFLFPLPLTLLVLLSLPAPLFIRSLCLKITELVFIRIPGTQFSLYSLGLGLSTILFALSSWVCFSIASLSSSFPPFSTSQSVWTHSLKPASQLNPQDHRCFRWRLERNFWISVLAFTVWLVLGRFRSALKESEKYRCALKEAESKTN
jgi:hypothetical protein